MRISPVGLSLVNVETMWRISNALGKQLLWSAVNSRSRRGFKEPEIHGKDSDKDTIGAALG